LSAEDEMACRAAVRWVLEPSEQSRCAAKSPAEGAGAASSAGALAAAAYQSASSSASGSSGIPPFAAAKAVARATKLASTQVEPIRIAETQRLFVELGVGVAEGRFVLPEIRSWASGWA
jgi:hypothetical protein